MLKSFALLCYSPIDIGWNSKSIDGWKEINNDKNDLKKTNINHTNFKRKNTINSGCDYNISIKELYNIIAVYKFNDKKKLKIILEIKKAICICPI